jgi:hypothetical protein
MVGVDDMAEKWGVRLGVLGAMSCPCCLLWGGGAKIKGRETWICGGHVQGQV